MNVDQPILVLKHNVLFIFLFPLCNFLNMEATSKTRPPSFKISILGDEEKKNLILALLNDVREVLVRQLDHPVNNADIIEKVFENILGKVRRKYL